MQKSSTNGVLLSSIPLNRKVKRYWISKYDRIASNCGADEACRKFKNLRVTVLRYLSDSNRRANLDSYLSSTGFRTNGYLKQLFEYAETQPHFVLSFLKLYSCEQKSTKSMDSAAGEVVKRLANVKANVAVPEYLQAWFECINTRHGKSYALATGDVNHPFHHLALNHSYDEWHAYWMKWYRVLRSGWQSSSSLDYKPVFPEIYKDYVESSLSSDSYQADLGDLFSMHMTEEPVLSQAQLDFVDEFLNEDVGDALQAVLWGETQGLEDLFQQTTILSGMFVGHVQHIHKKGGGTDLRDIAVPNRFIQNALVPCADRLYNLVRVLPKDATFDQDKFDILIQNRVNNENLYQGSVDLSKATDNLPLSWGEYIVFSLQKMFTPTSEEMTLFSIFGDPSTQASSLKQKEADFRTSFDLFRTVARANWEDEGYFVKWTVGQPLGSLPSFATLAITHNLLLESMAAHLGLLHSPYLVLGDDVVITNKKLRKRYIRELVSRGIPLSLHKSYEGRLSEFAGKTYVKGCVPFYCSDHNSVTWNSLFDWQRTTGIRIPWNNLPRSIQHRIEELVRKDFSRDEHPSKYAVVRLANSAYTLALTCEVPGRGSHLYQISDSEELSVRIAGYFERRITDSAVPDAVKHTGITLIGNGHPVVLMNDRFADKDGWFQRFRPVELPAWYKAKVRPCATDAAIQAAVGSCRSENGIIRYLRSLNV